MKQLTGGYASPAPLFSAIETAIPSEEIAAAVGKTDSREERSWQTPSPTGGLFGHRHESVVI